MTAPALRDRAIPPDDALARAPWPGLRGEREAAHRIVRAGPGPEAARAHAWLHRIGGDTANAGDWYRRAGKPAATGGTDAGGEAIARALAAR